MKYCVEFTTSRGINNLVAVPTTLRIDFDYKLPTTKNIRTRNMDNTLLDLQNSSYPTQPHSIIAKYIFLIYQQSDFYEDRKHKSTKRPPFCAHLVICNDQKVKSTNSPMNHFLVFKVFQSSCGLDCKIT